MDSMSPVERAERTFEAIVDWEAGKVRPVPTPVVFWTVSSRSEAAGGGCSDAADISLSLYGPDAGVVRAMARGHIEAFAAADADAAALSEFEARVAAARRLGHVEMRTERSDARLLWVGTRVDEMGETVTRTVEAVRGAARPDDEAVLHLARLLCEAKPEPPWFRRAA